MQLTNGRELARSIRSGDTKISVYGMGLVGSAIAAVWLRFGASVIAVDTNESVVERVSRGLGPRREPVIGRVFKRAVKEGRLRATTDGGEASRESRVKFVAVPVGLRGGSDADLTPLKHALRVIANNMNEGDVIIVKPTVPVGTSRRIAIPILESSGFRVEEGFLYVYSPERISAGTAVEDIEKNYPIIVSGAGPKSLKLGSTLYKLVAKAGVVEMSSLEAAEAEKIFEGVYRDVNIALANELAIISEGMKLDFEEVRRAANSQPYCNIHKPGLGVGGACIPVYPWFLVHNSLQLGFVPELTLTARRLNLSMPSYFAKLVDKEAGGVSGKTITILGLAYRGNVADKRYSPTYDLVFNLIRMGATDIRVHDPYFDGDELLERLGVLVTKDLSEALSNADVVVVATDHDEYKKLDSNLILSSSGKTPMIVDTRRVLDKRRLKGLRVVGLAMRGA